MRAFQESRVLLTAVELDVYTAVGEGATAAQVAERIGGDPRATEMFLHALAALGMVEKRDGVFYNGALAARYFVAGSPEDARAATLHTVNLWERWSNLTSRVCPGGPQSRVVPWTESFIAAMDAIARERAPGVVKAVGASGTRRMLDIGGGSGAYSIAFARANPELSAEILDVGAVVPIARRHIEAAGLSDRILVREGDLHQASYGAGYDLVFISSICHMLGPEENVEMLHKSREALVAGGRVVIQDFILDRDKTGPRPAALFALNMLVGTERGSSYSEDEYAGWLAGSGFREIRRIDLPGPSSLMVGSRAR
jgi:hypothetical protein